ncbi:four helix bundle protein [Pedobacter sp. BS3]|uniref:four helix bundle protein n=1 Tax=Pedobacter sp. BS3 TaxID=2567937 RepID=UPI0011EE0737|nr:four helix bundle protein [Pedobacter sp. BS3]TZF83885.1 four helix bundle protein [Pedobacter sp. BS3]
MAFRFENLVVWQKAFELSDEVDKIAKSFPKIEMFSLATQIKRASDSVVLNIAEGSTGQTKPEFARFLTYALRSAIEVVSCLFLAKKRGYINDETFTALYSGYESLSKMITSLKNSL